MHSFTTGSVIGRNDDIVLLAEFGDGAPVVRVVVDAVVGVCVLAGGSEGRRCHCEDDCGEELHAALLMVVVAA